MERKIFLVGTAILILLVLATGTVFLLQRINPTLHGSVITPPFLAPDFTLTSQTEQPIKLSDYRGRYVLLFFGYSHCTDECPVAMADLAQALRELGGQASDVQVLFVSTDPVGDTPASMTDFLGRFNPTFIGVLGTSTQLQQVWSAYGVTVLDGGETHSSYTYVIDPKGYLLMTYPYPPSPDDVAADLKLLFRKN
jgi:protein SCO1/2